MSAVESSASNSTLFYDALIEGLLRPEARYNADAHYLYFTLPPDDAFEGGTGCLSNCGDIMLRAAMRLTRARQRANDRRLAEGKAWRPERLREADHLRYLRRGLACLEISTEVGESRQKENCMIVRPVDLSRIPTQFGLIVQAGADPQSRTPIVYDLEGQQIYPDPLAIPSCRALYNYLTSQSAQVSG